MENKTVQWYHFLFAWLIMLILTSLIGAMFMGGFVLVSTFYAGIASAPFILVFCIVMHQIIKKKPSKLKMHALTLIWHLLGSICVLIGLYVFKNSETLRMGMGLVGLMAIYFVVDSLLFHLFIWRKHRPNGSVNNPNSEELLDALVE